MNINYLKSFGRFSLLFNIFSFVLGYLLHSYWTRYSLIDKQQFSRIFSSPLKFCPGGAGQLEASLIQSLERLNPGLVLDVGAYDGRDAIAYAKAGHNVLSFEPVPSKHRVIEQNFKKSGYDSSIKLYKIALSNYSGSTNFFTNRPLRRKDKWVEGDFGSEQDSMWVPWDGAKGISVPVDTLDNIVGMQKVLHAKIDAQGHDAVVLEGAKRLLSNGLVSTFSFEISPKLTPDPDSYIRLLDMLSKYQYQCYDCTSFEVFGVKEVFSYLAIEEYIKKLSQAKWEYRGGDHGKHSEIVCIFMGA